MRIFRHLILLLGLLSSVAYAARQVIWEAEDCQQVDKNVRAIYVSWASGATDTFNELKKDMTTALNGTGAQEKRLKGLYEKVFAKIEANEFSPPNVPDRVTGHNAAKQFALDLCAAEFK
jgi:hypothetical protein